MKQAANCIFAGKAQGYKLDGRGSTRVFPDERDFLGTIPDWALAIPLARNATAGCTDVLTVLVIQFLKGVAAIRRKAIIGFAIHHHSRDLGWRIVDLLLFDFPDFRAHAIGHVAFEHDLAAGTGQQADK